MATKPPGAGSGGKGLKGLTRRPALLLGGGAVALVVVIALIKRQSANSAAATTAATGTTAGNPMLPTYDSSLNDIYNQFEQQLEGLQSTLAALQQTPTTGATSSTPIAHYQPPPWTGTLQPYVGPPLIPGGAAFTPASQIGRP